VEFSPARGQNAGGARKEKGPFLNINPSFFNGLGYREQLNVLFHEFTHAILDVGHVAKQADFPARIAPNYRDYLTTGRPPKPIPVAYWHDIRHVFDLSKNPDTIAGFLGQWP
jgi:hypothetical protein